MLMFYTVSSKVVRDYMRPIPVLSVATSYIRRRQDGTYYLLPAKLPPQITIKGADCGGYRVATHWRGRYPFTMSEYLAWLYQLQPQWAATMDLPCLNEQGAYPGENEVRRRQGYTTEMAYLFWERSYHMPWSWLPTVQGYYPAEYEAHARDLAPLVREMHAYYCKPSWQQKGPEYAFRMGIGTLCRSLKPSEILEIIRVVADVIGHDIPLHLWGTKLRFLKHRVRAPEVLSLDTGAWDGRFGYAIEDQRQSGRTEAEYAWEVAQPKYSEKVQTAISAPKYVELPFEPAFNLKAAPGFQLYELYHQVEHFGSFGTREAEDRWANDRQRGFQRVAIVEAHDLEQVFELSNSYDAVWTQGEHVLWKVSPVLRSTSVGDVVIPVGTGQAWMVASHGYREVAAVESPGIDRNA